jgi:hypothetical protein
MVEDSVWRSAGFHVNDLIAVILGDTVRGQFCCIPCLEQRVGRQLTRADFRDCPVTDWFFEDHPRAALIRA